MGMATRLCLNTWSRVGGTILRRIGRYGVAGGDLSLGVSFEVSKVKYYAIPLCFLLMDRVSLGPAWAI